MSLQVLSSRAIIGEFVRALMQDNGTRWIDSVSALFGSDQASETYAWLGQVPQMREWIAGRHAKGFSSESITIENLHFEATVEILVRWLRRDKSGQAMMRIRELAERTNSHWAKLLSTLIIDGKSSVCYDGQFFFDTDHEEGDSGAQSNLISIDISTLPATVAGTITNPSPEEMQQCVLQAVTQITGFLDNQGEPMNENARDFMVMVPQTLAVPAFNAFTMPRGTGVSEQVQMDGFNISLASNARLNSWTDQFAVFSSSANTKALIRQEETAVQIKAKAEGSEYEFDHDAHQYGVDTWRNVGYGMWQEACHVTMT